jgi:sugar lactone lactonase YvrE
MNSTRCGIGCAPGRARTLFLVPTLLWAAIAVGGAPEIHSFTPVLEGHSVGGVTVDLLGNIFVADFGESVLKITPEGQREVFATGLYGASGNAIDHEGNLLQSNFYADSITKIDRRGQAQTFISSGLNGPVGIAVERQTGVIYVANCRSNSLARIAADGSVATFAKSELFKCPNGIAFGREGTLYVTNFRDNRILKVDPQGAVAVFATVSNKGLGHLCFKDDRFYVTAYESHSIYELSLDGTAKRILGNGTRGLVDGTSATARLSFPNGIACQPWVPRLYINEWLNESASALPRRAIVREIILDATRS